MSYVGNTICHYEKKKKEREKRKKTKPSGK